MSDYFNYDQADADMRAALAAGDGNRYAQIDAAVRRAKGEIPAYAPVPVPRQESWPLVAETTGDLSTYPRCTAGQRFGAFLIDWAAYVLLLLMFAFIPFIGWFLAICLLGGAIANQWVMGSTGQSLGKKAVGIYLVSEDTRQPIGGWAGIGRYFLHLLDSFALFTGWIVGLATGQTYADRIMRSIVVAKPKARA